MSVCSNGITHNISPLTSWIAASPKSIREPSAISSPIFLSACFLASSSSTIGICATSIWWIISSNLIFFGSPSCERNVSSWNSAAPAIFPIPITIISIIEPIAKVIPIWVITSFFELHITITEINIIVANPKNTTPSTYARESGGHNKK